MLIPGPKPPSLAKHTARPRATAFAARSVAFLPGRGSPGSVAAMVAGTRGTHSPPAGCVRDASACGPRRSAPHVFGGRRTRIGTARLGRARTSSRRVLAVQPCGAGTAIPVSRFLWATWRCSRASTAASSSSTTYWIHAVSNGCGARPSADTRGSHRERHRCAGRLVHRSWSIKTFELGSMTLTHEGADVGLAARDTEYMKVTRRADVNHGPPHDEGG